MLTNRSQEKELIDLGTDYYTAEEYQEFLKQLFTLNKLLGFFRDTVSCIKQFPTANSLVDVGCSDGLFLLHLSRYLPNLQLIGTDISLPAINAAQQQLLAWSKSNGTPNIRFQHQLQPELQLAPASVDIITATLVMHHLSDAELLVFLRDAYASARQAVIINDLYRHRMAEYLYRVLTQLLFRNRLIRYDGLISIRRGFTRADWQLLLNQASIKNYQLKLCFPFRWQVLICK